jgi:Nitric oxide reductase activation protein
MTIQLSEHQDVLEELGDRAKEVLEANWQDAARVFSPRGLQSYLDGATSLKALGRGTDLVIAFIESAPQVAREVGEQAAFELLSTAIKLYSKTSAAVLAMLFSTAPTAARRLGEMDLFRAYLTLLDQLLGQAPRALRPMLEKIDTLLGQLTLGGLRRWMMWGVSAHRNDFEAQAAYFSLSSPESQAVLQRERRGVLFVDVQRRLIMYLRALWGRDFFLRPTSGDFETRTGYRPYIEHYSIYLPDAYDDFTPAEGGDTVPGLQVYRAAAAHCAAHMLHSRLDPEAEDTTPLQRLFIGAIEDARVEALAVRNFPGLAPLWRSLSRLPQRAEDESPDGVGALLDRIALALLDPDCDDPHPVVRRARERFAAAIAEERLEDPAAARTIGLELADMLEGEATLDFSPRRDVPASPYRDDNRHLWQPPDGDAEGVLVPGREQQVRRRVSIMEMINTLDVETAGDDAQEIWILPTELYDDDGKTFNEKEGREPVSSPFHYHEWDYQTQLERPLWVTLYEKRPKAGDPEVVEKVLERHKPLVRRLKFLIEAIQPQGVVRQRKMEDGDELDINAAVDAMVDIRMGRQPDPRIGIRSRLQIRDLSVMLLIDLSESTNDPVRGAAGVSVAAASEGEGDGEQAPRQVTVLDLARESAALLAESLDTVGDPFAVYGFDSDGRHDVEFYRFKEFGAEYGDAVRARLAGMSGQLSTRMGAALRHAGTILRQQPTHRKLLLLLTDGEPSDNDVRDPQYLRYDTKRAVEELARQGVTTFCVSLDPDADQYVSRIFGAKNYMVLDQVERLPEKLPALYLSMTK